MLYDPLSSSRLLFSMVTRRLRITGVVQGVGYRESLRREAARTGIAGWVRNRTDGSVEALVRGTPEALDALSAWARRGPPLARVTNVAVEAAESEERAYEGFEVRPTV